MSFLEQDQLGKHVMYKHKWYLVIAASILMVAASFLAFQFWLDQRTKVAIDHISARLSPYAKIDYEGVHANIWTGMVHLNKVNIHLTDKSLAPIYIRDFGIKAEENKYHVLTRLRLNLHGVQLPIELADIYPFARQVLEIYGKDNLHGDFLIDYHFKPKQRLLSVIFFTRLDNLGELAIDLAAESFHPSLLSSWANFNRLPIQKLGLIYHDQSLISKLWEVLAEREGITKEQYQQQFVANLNQKILEIDNPTTKNSYQQLRDFIEKPNYLKISYSANPAINLDQAMSASSQVIMDHHIQLNYAAK